MMARRGVMGFLAGSFAAVLGGCGILGGNGYRFRMTVEVATPDGIKTGSSVMKVTAYKSFRLTSEEKAGGGGLTGEAVVVDLPGGPLFVTLKMPRAGDNLDTVTTLTLAPETPRGQLDAYVAAVNDLGGPFSNAKAELPRANWPLMVRFRDIADPKSVEQVDPEVIGVKRILVETTGDAVTTGIEKQLAWLSNEGLTLDPSGGIDFLGYPPLAKQIRQRDFKSGTWK